jgi:hypothetical protein
VLTSIRIGDKVAVLNSTKMPFLLGDRVSRFMLIRLYYIKGYSNRELAAIARRGEVPVEDILIS